MNIERKDTGVYTELENDVIFPYCEEVVWVSGYGGAGKSTFAKFLQQEYGYTRCDLGPWVRKLYSEEARLKNGKILPFFDWIYNRVSTIGDDGFSLWVLKSYVEANPEVLKAKKVVIPSARSTESVNFLKKSFPNATQVLVAITCDQETRADRIRKRMLKAGELSNYSVEDLRKRDSLEDKTGIREVFEIADVVIDNNGNLEDFLQAINSLFSKKAS